MKCVTATRSIEDRLQSTTLEDCAMLCLAVVMLAFGDYRMLNIAIQVLAFLVVLMGYFRRNDLRLTASVGWYTGIKCLFLIWCFLSCTWAINADHSFAQSITVGLRLMTGLTVVAYVDSYPRLEKLLRYVVVACVVLCLRLVVVVPFSAWGTDRVGNYLSHDEASSYGNTGITYVLGVSGIYLLLFKNACSRHLRWPLFALFAVASIFSGSKKEVVILALGILTYSVLKSDNATSTVKNLAIAFAAVVAAMFAIFYIQPLYDILGSRIVSFLSFFSGGLNGTVDNSTLDRSAFIGYAIDAFLSSPFLGLGIDDFRYVNPISLVWSECNFVELLADVGFIGFLLYYLFAAILLKRSLSTSTIKEARTRNVIVLFAVLFFIDTSMVSYANNALQLHWAILWAIAWVDQSRGNAADCSPLDKKTSGYLGI